MSKHSLVKRGRSVKSIPKGRRFTQRIHGGHSEQLATSFIAKRGTGVLALESWHSGQVGI